MKVIANSCQCALRHDDTDGNPKEQIESNPHCISPHSSCPTLLLGSLGFSWLEGRAIIALVRAEETDRLINSRDFAAQECAVKWRLRFKTKTVFVVLCYVGFS